MQLITFPRIPDDDEMAAKVGVTETTIEPASFPHPTNSKIKFWDLPGIGTPNYPDLKTYCEKVMLEKYDTFLIFTAGRFTENDLKLAEKIRSVEKKFFFIRTKIDDNVRAEKRKRNFDEESMLNKIRRDCSKNLVDLVEDIREIFLISNHETDKWDFVRLTEAIIDVLPVRQRESLTLSLGIVKSLSTKILGRKIEVLKSRMWMVATMASFSTLTVPLPGLSISVNLRLIIAEITFYTSELGLPKEGSERFQNLDAQLQERVRKFCLIDAEKVATLLDDYSPESAIEGVARFIPIIGSVMSFRSTYYILQRSLEEIEKTAIMVLDDIVSRSVED